MTPKKKLLRRGARTCAALPVLALLLLAACHPGSRTRAWNEYYEKASDRPPRPLLLRSLALFEGEGRPVRLAVDAGCGVGIDTIYLLQQGIPVYAFDSEPRAIEQLMARVPESFGHLIQTEVTTFTEASWPAPADLVFAGFALPFAPPERFPDIWSKLTASIADNGRFAGHFFGDRDTWAVNEKHTFHLTRAEVEQLFTDQFVIEVLDETEKDAPSSADAMKHWHIFYVIARKLAPGPHDPAVSGSGDGR